MERIITKVSRPMLIPLVLKKKRVAAYARVSCDKETMLHSLSAQVSYYSGYIQKHPDWEYVGVYADEAISGTKDDRREFQRLLHDCRAGFIDMVITKSISRLARNTVTMLEVARELKRINVDVFFEKENIHSISEDGELMLSIFASFAEAESLSVSENCKWRIRKRFEVGDIVNWRFMFGYRIVKGKIEINQEEAEIVRSIFRDYINGKTTTEIARRLQTKGVPTKFGGKWTVKRVIDMLTNEKYAGNALLGKKYVRDHLTKTLVRNTGQLPQYYALGTHEALVSLETFQQAQAIYKHNKEKAATSHSSTKRCPFSGIIRCPHCGKNYKRQVRNGKVSWNCATYLKEGKAVCHTKQIPEETLYRVTTEVLGLSEFDEFVFKKVIREIVVPEFNTLVFVFMDGKKIKRIWQDRPCNEIWTKEMRQQAREREFERRRGNK